MIEEIIEVLLRVWFIQTLFLNGIKSIFAGLQVLAQELICMLDILEIDIFGLFLLFDT